MRRNKVKKPTLPLKSKLRKDPGVPRLPDLKVHSAEIQRRRTSPLRDPPHGDGKMASEPTLSSLAHLAASAAASELAGGDGKTKEQLRRQYIRALHKVVYEAGFVCSCGRAQPRCGGADGEGKWLLFGSTTITWKNPNHSNLRQIDISVFDDI
ncbi:hypothetical protein EDB85DRAFT_2289296 [Lactarius pseudohatsudake]|nr:hypothetical protein EDB85DRAFT_2289296 [Lactarius pseudohatsudake]